MRGIARPKLIAVSGLAALVVAVAVQDAVGQFTAPRRGQIVRRPAGAGVPPIVRLAVKAGRTLRYSGVRVVEFLTSSEPERHVEYILKDGPRSRVWFPDRSPYAGQIIVERANQRFHFFPATNEIQKSSARGEGTYNRLVQMIRGNQCRVTVARDGVIAGIATRVATITDQGGYVVQRLWVDPETGMVLRRVFYDSSRKRVGFFEFQSVTFNPQIKPGDFAIDRPGGRYVQLRDKVAEMSRRTGLLPYAINRGRGYDLTAVRLLQPNGKHPTLVQTYRGTQGSVSLFQTTGPINAKRLERMAAGRYQTYTWRQEGSNFALVGDLGVAELQRIAGLVGAG